MAQQDILRFDDIKDLYTLIPADKRVAVKLLEALLKSADYNIVCSSTYESIKVTLLDFDVFNNERLVPFEASVVNSGGRVTWEVRSDGTAWIQWQGKAGRPMARKRPAPASNNNLVVEQRREQAQTSLLSRVASNILKEASMLIGGEDLAQ